MRCYHCLHGHAVKLSTLEQKGKSTELHGLCAGCMGKLETAVFKMKEAIRRQDRDSLGEEVGRFRTYIATELGLALTHPAIDDDGVEEVL